MLQKQRNKCYLYSAECCAFLRDITWLPNTENVMRILNFHDSVSPCFISSHYCLSHLSLICNLPAPIFNLDLLPIFHTLCLILVKFFPSNWSDQPHPTLWWPRSQRPVEALLVILHFPAPVLFLYIVIILKLKISFSFCWVAPEFVPVVGKPASVFLMASIWTNQLTSSFSTHFVPFLITPLTVLYVHLVPFLVSLVFNLTNNPLPVLRAIF